MKKLIYLLFAIIIAIGIASCSQKQEETPKWEYKTLVVEARPYNDFAVPMISYPQERLDTLGSQGWELVDVYTIVETVHPNFGDSKYVTGLQPNTRLNRVNYVFKRRVHDGNKTESHFERYEEQTAVVEAEPVEVAE